MKGERNRVVKQLQHFSSIVQQYILTTKAYVTKYIIIIILCLLSTHKHVLCKIYLWQFTCAVIEFIYITLTIYVQHWDYYCSAITNLVTIFMDFFFFYRIDCMMHISTRCTWPQTTLIHSLLFIQTEFYCSVFPSAMAQPILQLYCDTAHYYMDGSVWKSPFYHHYYGHNFSVVNWEHGSVAEKQRDSENKIFIFSYYSFGMGTYCIFNVNVFFYVLLRMR